jgi:hypothetical protein
VKLHEGDLEEKMEDTKQDEKSVFEKAYEMYLSQLRELSFASIAPKIGAEFSQGRLRLPLLDRIFEVSSAGIVGPDGKRPGYDVCVILSKYLLLCPEAPVQGKSWLSFKDFKDTRPLHNYFANDVERAIAGHFSRRLDVLKRACTVLDGYVPELQVSYDLAMEFDALPLIPIVLLFNDADLEFPAQCTILFPSRTEAYLDGECIAMLGFQLFRRLRKAAAEQ